MTRQVSIDDPRTFISADDFFHIVYELSDGCDEGFEQVIDCAKCHFNDEFGEDNYVVETFSDEHKENLFNAMSGSMEELIADEDSDWNYFELSMIDDLFDDITTIDDPYTPAPVIKEVVVEVTKEVHVHHTSKPQQQDDMGGQTVVKRRICPISQEYIGESPAHINGHELPQLPNTRWNEKYQ